METVPWFTELCDCFQKGGVCLSVWFACGGLSSYMGVHLRRKNIMSEWWRGTRLCLQMYGAPSFSLLAGAHWKMCSGSVRLSINGIYIEPCNQWVLFFKVLHYDRPRGFTINVSCLTLPCSPFLLLSKICGSSSGQRLHWSGFFL